jgi:hypothetical protein
MSAKAPRLTCCALLTYPYEDGPSFSPYEVAAQLAHEVELDLEQMAKLAQQLHVLLVHLEVDVAAVDPGE